MKKASPATTLYFEWKKTKDPEKHDKLIHSLDGVVSSALKTYGGNDNTLKTRAYILTSKAIDNYNPQRDVKLESHVYNNLKRLSRYRNERNTAIHIPENVRADSMHVYRFMDEFRDINNREPTLEEIKDNTGLSYPRINRARQVGSEKNLSQFETEKGDVLVGEKRSYADIWKDYVYYDLDPVDKKIFEWLTGYQDSPIISKKEISEKLSMSPAAVTQRTNKIVKQIRKGMTGTESF